ncbi:hypothetical protein HYS28_00985 [Candidatus Uhrbacteria bacterium]|nr:hypothetical protein [Candidatus Uhrbacteria bacterium]
MRLLRLCSAVVLLVSLMGVAPTESENDYKADPHCWFGAYGPMVATERHPDGSMKTGRRQLVGVATLPQMDRVGTDKIRAKPGQQVTLRFTLRSYNDCGDLRINRFEFQFKPTWEEKRPWVDKMAKGDDPATVIIGAKDGGKTYAVRPVSVTGVQVFYTLSDQSTVGGRQTQIAPVSVKAYEPVEVQFVWTVPEDAPKGSVFSLHLAAIGWDDVTTGAKIGDDHSPHDDTYVYVTVDGQAS